MNLMDFDETVQRKKDNYNNMFYSKPTFRRFIFFFYFFFFFFFFFLMKSMREGDVPGRSSPKGLDWPLHREKKKKRGILWAGQELEVSVDAGLKQLKVISRGEDGGRE